MARFYPKRFFICLSFVFGVCYIFRVYFEVKERTSIVTRTRKVLTAPVVEPMASLINSLNGLHKDFRDITSSRGHPLLAKEKAATEDQYNALVNRVDTFLKESEAFLRYYDVKRQRVNTDWQKDQNNFSCPEKYMGSTYGYPFYRVGFITSNCSQIGIENLVTFLIINNRGDKTENIKQINAILDNIMVLHKGIRIHLVLYGDDTEGILLNNRTKSIHVHMFNSAHFSYLEILKVIHTEFTFVLPYITSYDKDTDINRLLRILTTTKLPVLAVGGAVKDYKTGYWNKACVQTSLSKYVYHKRLGYYKSFNECLLCDMLAGPFLTRTDTLRIVSLDSLGVGTFEDWFLKIKIRTDGVDKLRVVSCPDVMFTQHTTVNDVELKPFADKWDIKKIIEPDGQVRWYGCRNGITHRDRKCVWHYGMAVPPCCLANLADAIQFVMTTCMNHNITCELQEGTLLGALKFGYVLPWERDADITFLTADFDKLVARKPEFNKARYKFTIMSSPWCCADGIQAGGVIRVSFRNWVIEMYGQHKMDSVNYLKMGETKTKVKFGDTFLPAPRNPGQYARNRYGHEIYRHAEHWLTIGHASGWNPYNAGRFQPCSHPGHHACLDRYDADGNFQFD